MDVVAVKPSDWPVEGLLLHVAGETASGFRVIDVWQSEQPEVYSAHTFVSA